MEGGATLARLAYRTRQTQRGVERAAGARPRAGDARQRRRERIGQRRVSHADRDQRARALAARPERERPRQEALAVLCLTAVRETAAVGVGAAATLRVA